ncbi:hypothetical protein VTI74DRAFT_7392 [Chaetomium olivicolor]
MACRSCSAGLPRRLTAPLRQSLSENAQFQRSILCGSATSPSPSLPPFLTAPNTSHGNARRAFHATSPRHKLDLKKLLFHRVAQSLVKGKSSYFIYKATETMYKACAAQADYTIEAADRKSGKLQTAEDGEEIGASNGGPWHAELTLPPTFSTWAQVTMLHMYLLVVRFRCFDPAAQQAFQAQLVNHFFYHAEAKMEDVHELHSRMIRQKYLKDLFVQWRGLILAYDEGLVKGDAVLASAVWRNLFKAREDVDVRALAAVVSWMRAGLSRLGAMTDEDAELRGHTAFPALTDEFRTVDVPSASLKAAIEQAANRS